MLAGCVASSTLLPTPSANWRSHVGQLSYESKTRSFIGDIVIQTSPTGDLTLDLTKGPGPTLMRLRQTADLAQVRGAAVGMGWQGHPSDASTQLTGWLLVQPVIAALEAGQPLPKGVIATMKKSSEGRWQVLKIDIPARQESFHFIFES